MRSTRRHPHRVSPYFGIVGRASWRVSIIACVCVVAWITPPAADEVPAVNGKWTVDRSESDKLDDKLDKIAQRYSAGFRNGRLDSDATDHRRRERRRRQQFDPIRSIATTETLAISGYDTVKIRYGDTLQRQLQPNLEGRVYSASGEELIEDEFGRSLSFWDGAVLTIETSNSSGIKISERYHVHHDSGRLVAKLSIKARGEGRIELSRQFNQSQ